MNSLSLINKGNHAFKAVLFISFSIFLIAVSSKASAQLATLNSNKVISSIPKIKQIDSLILDKQQAYAQQYNDKYFTTQKILVAADSLNKIAPTTPEAATANQKADIAQKELQLFEEEATKTVKTFRDSLMQPYYDRINLIIKAVAKKHNYKQVVDMQQVSLLYADPSADITEEVIVELSK